MIELRLRDAKAVPTGCPGYCSATQYGRLKHGYEVESHTRRRTPSERFERVMRRVMARDHRAMKKRNGATGRHERSTASRSKDLNRVRSAKKLG